MCPCFGACFGVRAEVCVPYGRGNTGHFNLGETGHYYLGATLGVCPLRKVPTVRCVSCVSLPASQSEA